jgi:TonB-dependent receptor
MLPAFLWAQNGLIRGQVIEGETGEPLFMANVTLKGTLNGVTTDFDGNFEISAEPGTYTVEFSFIGLNTITVTDVKVMADEVFVVPAVKLESSNLELGEVTITVDAVRNTETALITVKKKSVSLMDGVSAAKLKKTGDSDAGDAAKRVTGVSVEGGKYVYVRGLGDRYTKTMLNGVDVPGLDPDRNSIQIDIFPTSLLENMMITKSSLAELPADYTGGLVNIETKEFPVKKIFSVSASVNYNPSMHFNSDYRNYEGGSTDFLGFDDGTRAVPDEVRTGDQFLRPGLSSPEKVSAFNRSFSKDLGADEATSPLDFGLGITSGNQYTLSNGNKLGYIFSATYKNETKFYENAINGEYVIDPSDTVYELVQATSQVGTQSEKNILLGGLAGIAYKTDAAKYKMTLMHLQNGLSTTSQQRVSSEDGVIGQSDYNAIADILTYSQRGLTNLLIAGEHYWDEGDWKIEWTASPTLSNIVEPDLRRTAFTLRPGQFTFAPGEGGNPQRSWRYLDEINTVAKIDFTREFEQFDRPAKFKFGASHVYKNRDYEILSVDLQSVGTQPSYSGDPDDVLVDENLFSEGELFYSITSGVPNPNEFNSYSSNLGAYVSGEFSPSMRLKTIVGLRMEQFVQFHTGRSIAPPNDLEDEKILDAIDLFPSANLIYALTEDQNLRFSYSRSIARPSFKELSFAQIIDPVTNRIFNGGLFVYNGRWDGNLTETRINNLDVRWELFMERGELFSVSAFWKSFDDPIELVRVQDVSATSEFQPRNVGDGQLFGVELEARKSLGFISPALNKFSANFNYTWVRSRISMTLVEFDQRVAFEKEGETIEDERAMAGQAPYVINGGVSYDDLERNFNAGLYYNVKGKTLAIVGSGIFPDVFTEPFHSLNFTANKSFGKDGKTTVNFKVSNLLNDVTELFYNGYEADPQLFSSLAPGTAFSFGVSYNFD